MNFAPHVFATKQAAAEAAGGHILERLAAARRVAGRATLAVSGGVHAEVDVPSYGRGRLRLGGSPYLLG